MSAVTARKTNTNEVVLLVADPRTKEDQEALKLLESVSELRLIVTAADFEEWHKPFATTPLGPLLGVDEIREFVANYSPSQSRP